jgi:hypothetical protein
MSESASWLGRGEGGAVFAGQVENDVCLSVLMRLFVVSPLPPLTVAIDVQSVRALLLLVVGRKDQRDGVDVAYLGADIPGSRSVRPPQTHPGHPYDRDHCDVAQRGRPYYRSRNPMKREASCEAPPRAGGGRRRCDKGRVGG